MAGIHGSKQFLFCDKTTLRTAFCLHLTVIGTALGAVIREEAIP